MLKWAKTPQGSRRISECSSANSDYNFETCSNLSSDSSESGITDLSVPIRYHERRASGRPKSLALSSGDILDLDNYQDVMNNGGVTRRASRTASSPMYSSCSRAKRHSMFIEPTARQSNLTNNNDIMKISTTSSPAANYDETDNSMMGALKISTTASDSTEVLKISTNNNCDNKTKSRNSFWKNLRARAQGKKDNKKLAKAHSMSNLPDMKPNTDTNTAYSDQTQQSVPSTIVAPTTEPIATLSYTTTCHSPVVMRRQSTNQQPDSASPSTSRTKANVQRRRSFKLIKKQNENKKPKPFSKQISDVSSFDYPIAGSPDSGISSMRHPSNTDSDFDGAESSPSSPVTPIDLESNSTDLTCLRQQFTDAVLQYLNERLEKKGMQTIQPDRTSSISTSSLQSEDGAPDIFCYDTDTVVRRPSHRQQSVQVTH